MESTKRRIQSVSNWLLFLIFLFLIFSPLVVQVTGFELPGGNTENRGFASFPEFAMGNDTISTYPDLVETYYNDNFGLRNQLIIANNYISLKGFRVPSTPKVIVGKDGWYFSGLPALIDSYTSQSYLDDAELERWGQPFLRIQEWLKQRDILFLIVLIPDKQEFYGEFLPDHIRRGPYPTVFTQRVEWLKAHTDIDIIELLPLYTGAKKNHHLFFKTDRHWSPRGAIIAYREILEHLSQRFPDISPISDQDFLWEKRTRSRGNQVRDLGFPELQEEFEHATFTGERRAKKIVSHEYDPPHSLRGPVYYPQIYETGDGALPNAVMYRDSFAIQHMVDFAEHFERITYIWGKHHKKQWGVDFDLEIVDQEKPDVFIYQAVHGAVPAAPTVSLPREQIQSQR